MVVRQRQTLDIDSQVLSIIENIYAYCKDNELYKNNCSIESLYKEISNTSKEPSKKEILLFRLCLRYLAHRYPIYMAGSFLETKFFNALKLKTSFALEEKISYIIANYIEELRNQKELENQDENCDYFNPINFSSSLHIVP